MLARPFEDDDRDTASARKRGGRYHDLAQLASACEAALASDVPLTPAALNRIVPLVSLHGTPGTMPLSPAELFAAQTALTQIAEHAHALMRIGDAGDPALAQSALDAAIERLVTLATQHSSFADAEMTIAHAESRPLSDPFTPENAHRLFELYTLQNQLGTGAQGTVYLARNNATGGQVAIKLRAVNNETAARSARNEIAINSLLVDVRRAGLAHQLRNIAQPVDYAYAHLAGSVSDAARTSGDCSVLVMEAALCTFEHAIQCASPTTAPMAGCAIRWLGADPGTTIAQFGEFVRSIACQVLCQLHNLALMFPENFSHNDLRAGNVLIRREEARAFVEYRVDEALLRMPTPNYAALIADFGLTGVTYRAIADTAVDDDDDSDSAESLWQDSSFVAVALGSLPRRSAAPPIVEDMRKFINGTLATLRHARPRSGASLIDHTLIRDFTKLLNDITDIDFDDEPGENVLPTLLAEQPNFLAAFIVEPAAGNPDADAAPLSQPINPFSTRRIEAGRFHQ